MADRILPNVRLLLPCDDVVYDLAGDVWVIRNPWTAVELPVGARFPFRADDVWVYTQLTDGLGAFDLAVEVVQVRDDGSLRQVGVGGAVRQMVFTADNQLIPVPTAFHLRSVPFRREGLYEFRLVADADAGYQPLPGETARAQVLDRRGRI